MTDNEATRSANDCYKGRAAVLKDSYSEPYLINSRIAAEDVGPLDVLVHIHYSGVCYGDLHSRDGGPHAPSQPLRPLIGGRKGVGVFIELGIAAGEVVNGLQTDGTFREYLVAPARHVLRIADGFDPASATPILCGGGATVATRRRGEVSVGKWVAISSAAGSLGHLATQYAKAMGANVVAMDGPEPEKRESCLNLGTDRYFDFANGNICSEVLKVSRR
ncbi:hypothetical protein FOXYS1_1717 [Fusarium oxysporum]|uniref:alcohol dehydrogenase n=1 Tax=Fusarium oxysporum TaxID=5507 RepID=A0A8H5ALZ7_FUSOX|nr:hypothetical protein FOXYS1_1717 [Fusarium oxysporum]